MPLYRFIVFDGSPYDDPEGVELADDAAASKEALEVIKELKKNNPKWNGLTMQVLDGGRVVWKMPFNEQ